MTGSLASVHPELIPEWSEKNLPLTPDDGQEIQTPVTKKVNTDIAQTAIVGSVPCGSPQYEEENAEDGDIVVALVENQNTLKRFYRDNDNRKVILHPENKRMKDIIVDDCFIQGVACHVIKSL